MKSSIRLISILILIVLASPAILLLKGCGKEELGSAECPSGSVVANSTDILIAPASTTLKIGAPSLGGSVIYAPLVFTVTDVNKVPRTKVCVVLYTDGFFFTDDTYTALLPGVGPMSRVAKKTDDFGNVYMYWSTEILPPSGATDITSDTWVNAYSGSIQKQYLVTWTVQSPTAAVGALAITTTSPLPNGTVGTPYAAIITASGGTTPYAWTASGLPAGLSIAPFTTTQAQISGTPTTALTANVNVTVTDTSIPTSTTVGVTFAITINP